MHWSVLTFWICRRSSFSWSQSFRTPCASSTLPSPPSSSACKSHTCCFHLLNFCHDTPFFITHTHTHTHIRTQTVLSLSLSLSHSPSSPLPSLLPNTEKQTCLYWKKRTMPENHLQFTNARCWWWWMVIAMKEFLWWCMFPPRDGALCYEQWLTWTVGRQSNYWPGWQARWFSLSACWFCPLCLRGNPHSPAAIYKYKFITCSHIYNTNSLLAAIYTIQIHYLSQTLEIQQASYEMHNQITNNKMTMFTVGFKDSGIYWVRCECDSGLLKTMGYTGWDMWVWQWFKDNGIYWVRLRYVSVTVV